MITVGQAADRLNATLSAVEDAMRDRRDAFTAPMAIDYDSLGVKFTLTWGKIGGEYRIGARIGDTHDPLINASLEVRCAAVTVLPQLIAEAERSAARLVAQIDDANDKAAAVLARLISGTE